MIVPKTHEDILQLIRNGVEESQQLEYKDAQALSEKTIREIAKDVSGMANAVGGIIIYGVGEQCESGKDHLPGEITPVFRDAFSKERLEQIINGNISPAIEGLKIHPIPVEEPNKVIYVVEIPPSTTAHQNTKDFKYYKRRNFEVVPMVDFEVRDVMNRLKYPKVEIVFKFVRRASQIDVSGTISPPIPNLDLPVIHELDLEIRARNGGNQFAQYVNYFIKVPKEIMDEDHVLRQGQTSGTHVEIYGDNTFRDLLGAGGPPFVQPTYGPSRYEPILPGLSTRPRTITLEPLTILDDREIMWFVHADNAPERSGRIKLREILLTDYSG